MIPKSWSKEYKSQVLEELSAEFINEVKEEIAEPKITAIGEYVDAAEARVNKKGLDGLSTGYDTLDSYLDGMAPGELIVVGGGTGQGKTHLCQAIMLNMALNSVPSLFFTLEMPHVDVTIRFRTMAHSKSIGLEGASETIRSLPIYFDSNSIDDLNLETMDAAIESAIKDHQVKIVFIDHLHFFCRKVDGQSAEIGNITRKIKLMAIKHNIPIVLISHIIKLYDRKKIPTLDDLNGSSFISQDADMVLMVWRDKDNLYGTSNEMTVKIRKNRRRGILEASRFKIDSCYYLNEAEYVDAIQNDY